MKHDEITPEMEKKANENFNKFVADSIQYAALIKPPEVPENLTKNMPANAVQTMALLIASVLGAKVAGLPAEEIKKTVDILYNGLKIEAVQ